MTEGAPGEPQEGASPSWRDDPAIRASLRKLIISLCVLFAIVVALGLAFKDPIEQFARGLIDTYGYFGIALGIFAADCFTAPIPPDFYLMVGATGGADPWIVIAVGSIASITGGMGAYSIGRVFAKGFLRRHFQGMQREGARLLNRLGVVAVIVAALTPVPFSVVCVVAGSAQMRFRLFCAAILFRIPRIAGYFFVIDAAWGSG